MSRHQITLGFQDKTDADAAIGYDKPLRTFFLQGFVNDDETTDRPEIWLGAYLEEFPTLEALSKEVRDRGYAIQRLDQSYIITMLAEAGQKPKPSLGERLGIVL